MEPLLPVVLPIQVWKGAVDGDIGPRPEEGRRLQFVAHGSNPDLTNSFTINPFLTVWTPPGTTPGKYLIFTTNAPSPHLGEVW